jgi:hypothetical protein
LELRVIRELPENLGAQGVKLQKVATGIPISAKIRAEIHMVKFDRASYKRDAI